MDFFDRQERARKKTALLVFYFAFAVIGIVAVLQFIFAKLLGLPPTDLELLAWVACGVGGVVAIGSLAKMAELSQGGRVVAAMLGGEQIPQHTDDPALARLVNVVEEMSIASGVPVPEIYVLPDSAINAFAAGHGPGDTAIGITRGAVDRLGRDELQGVIAHEFSHILHGDMRLNIRLMGVLNGILCLALIGGFLLRMTVYMPSGGSSRDRNKNGGVFLVLGAGLALYIVGWIGMFFGNLIKAAVSRQREFLADAAAVQFTRNPRGIAGALWKIGKFTARLTSPRAAEASHMYFGNGLADPFIGLFATHPPIQDRIAAIAPDFQPDPTPPPIAPPASRRQTTPPPIFGGLPATALAPFAATDAPPETSYAASLLGGIPPNFRAAARELDSACALIYGLILSDDEAARSAQLSSLDAPASQREAASSFFSSKGGVSGAARIALVDLSIPTLRHLSPEQYGFFRKNIRALIEADGQEDLFEFVLGKILVRHLDLYFTRSTGAEVKYRSIVPVIDKIGILLSALSIAGQESGDARAEAFRAGVRELLFKPSSTPLALSESVGVSDLDGALDALALASPEVKRTVLKACAQCVAHDGIVLGAEYEILRAVADALDCPMPPIPQPPAGVRGGDENPGPPDPAPDA